MIRIGLRTLVAATCLKCGELFDGPVFKRHVRRIGEPAYVDRRCVNCKWGTRVNGKAA